jgi:glutathione synthase/RimK-type ligase-like ATP-grasp enzyme
MPGNGQRRVLRVLLSEGSGLTSRQVANRLGTLGHHVEILSSTPVCLTRFTRHVRALHRVPRFADDPLAWFEAANGVAKTRDIDVLLPTQEQVAVLSALHPRRDVATVVPDFAALRRVQDKIEAWRTLEAIGIPQPDSVVVRNKNDLARVVRFPVFVKRPISTASAGVRRAATAAELATAATALGLGSGELLVQTQASGPLAMVQALADHGRLVAHHANLRILEGIGGGAAIKESVVLPTLAEHLERLVQELGWHGPISMDVIVTDGGPLVIDVNPRLVEPINAALAGVDLVGAMLELAQNGHPAPVPAGKPGLRSCQLLLCILGAAEHGSRRGILRELIDGVRRRGAYERAVEELTPLGGDPIAALPVILAVLVTLTKPSLWRLFHAGATGPYSLTPEAWRKIVASSERTRDLEIPGSRFAPPE